MGGARGKLLLPFYRVSIWSDEKILEIVVIVAHTKKIHIRIILF